MNDLSTAVFWELRDLLTACMRPQVYTTPELKGRALTSPGTMPLKHIAITVERNPFSEQLEVTDLRYVTDAPSKVKG